MHNFNVINVHHEEGEVTDSNKAVLGWSNLDHLSLRTAKESHLILRHIYIDWSLGPPRCLLNELCIVMEPCVKALSGCTLSLLFLQLVEVIAFAATLDDVDVFSLHTKFFVELDVLDRFLTEKDR